MSVNKMTGDARRRRRLMLYLGQRGRCFWCDRKIQLEAATLDHVMPRSKGGGNYVHNLVVACGPCNNKRGDADPPHRDHREISADRPTGEQR